MRKPVTILCATLMLAGCGTTGTTVQADIAKVQAIISQVQAGGQVALQDAQIALPYVCSLGSIADGAFTLLVAPNHPDWVSDEQKAMAAFNKICDPNFKITDPSAVLKQALDIYKSIATKP